MKARVANPRGNTAKRHASEAAARAKTLPLFGSRPPPAAPSGSRLRTHHNRNTGASAAQRQAYAQEARARAQAHAATEAKKDAEAAAKDAKERQKQAEHDAKKKQEETRAAMREFDKKLAAHKRAAKPKKTQTKKEEKKMGKAARSPAQIAATKRMLEARAKQLASGTKPKKPKTKKHAAPKTKKKPNRNTFKSPWRVTVTRKKNPSVPELAKAVGGTLVGAAVGAVGIVATGKLADRFKLSKNKQIAMLVASGTVVGIAAGLVSPFAGAASALPMYAMAAGIAAGTTLPRPEPVAALGGPRRGAGRGVMQQMGEVRRIGAVVSPYATGVHGIVDPLAARESDIAAIVNGAYWRNN